MQTKNIKVFSLTLLAILLGCSKSDLNREAYVEWFHNSENDARKSREVGDFIFDLQYEPNDILVLREDPSANQQKIKEEKESRKGMQYYRLKLSVKGGKDLLEYGAKNTSDVQAHIYYYSFTMQQDIYLEQSGKKIPCAIMHFERSYDLKSERSFVLGFEDADNGKGDVTLVIDSSLLGTGPVKFNFKRNEFPKLNLE